MPINADASLHRGDSALTDRKLSRRTAEQEEAARPSTANKKPKVDTKTPYDYRRIQGERRTRVRQTCSAMGFDMTYNISTDLDSATLKKFDFLLAIPDMKLIYCYVPKVSCTSWKRLLLSLNGYTCFLNDTCGADAHMLARRRFVRMSRMTVAAAQEIFTSYTSFFFVRNPYSRVLSAYLEKVLYHPESKIQNELTEWFKEHHPGQTHENQSQPFTYREFVTHYMKAGEKNQHWEDMNKLCFPCHVNYDFIGHYETLKPDSDFILDLANAPANVRFPTPQKKPTYSSDEETLAKFYSQLTDQDLDHLTVSRGFATDATMFGYQMPDCIRRD
ncbi:carbohydrate sulfotransferase 11-like [Diadema antillarum]|uniref:carbohydrate sulfotransferase 11-like n=1 Tax=Diadema antillarum TaxID=105358 RepID=UPI003A836C56